MIIILQQHPLMGCDQASSSAAAPAMPQASVKADPAVAAAPLLGGGGALIGAVDGAEDGTEEMTAGACRYEHSELGDGLL